MSQPSNEQQLSLKVSDEILRGFYANAMQVTHSQEEFVLDFMNLVPPQGQIGARIITSPGHFKRIILALQDNLQKYEQQFGNITAAKNPEKEIGFKIND